MLNWQWKASEFATYVLALLPLNLDASKDPTRGGINDKVLTLAGVLLGDHLRSVWGSPTPLLGGGGGGCAFCTVLDTAEFS
jgi:hypothetical protein